MGKPLPSKIYRDRDQARRPARRQRRTDPRQHPRQGRATCTCAPRWMTTCAISTPPACFYNIQVAADDTTDGMVLTYMVQGKPRLTDIKFQGNKKFSDTKLLKKITSKVGEPLDERKLFTDTQEIQKLYQKAGYPAHAGQIRPEHRRERGPRHGHVRDHRKPQGQDRSRSTSSAPMLSRKRNCARSSRPASTGCSPGSPAAACSRTSSSRRTRKSCAQFYRDKGYIDFEIKDVSSHNPTPRTMIIRFTIYEGTPIQSRLGQVHGNKLFTVADIAQGLRDLQRREEAGVLTRQRSSARTACRWTWATSSPPRDLPRTSRRRGFLRRAEATSTSLRHAI